MLPSPSCSLPASFFSRLGTHQTKRFRKLFGLAPDGVYQAFGVTAETGELLPHRFTLTCKNRRFIFCGTIHASLRLPVRKHPFRWSPDFPLPFSWERLSPLLFHFHFSFLLALENILNNADKRGSYKVYHLS